MAPLRSLVLLIMNMLNQDARYKETTQLMYNDAAAPICACQVIQRGGLILFAAHFIKGSAKPRHFLIYGPDRMLFCPLSTHPESCFTF